MKRAALILIPALLVVSWVGAQATGRDPLRRYLFRPDLIMRHQEELKLDEEQQKYIVQQIQQAQSRFTALEWDLQKQVQKMAALLKSEQVPEEEVLTQLDKLLDLERQIKRMHLLLAVRIRNRLTPEQRAKLRTMRNGQRRARRGFRSRTRPNRPSH